MNTEDTPVSETEVMHMKQATHVGIHAKDNLNDTCKTLLIMCTNYKNRMLACTRIVNFPLSCTLYTSPLSSV